jgi:dolichol-phosphate mannosyltransferase
MRTRQPAAASTADRTLVMIATYNERHNLVPLLERIWDAVDVDVLLIDDSSPDGTGRIADMVAAVDRRLTVVHRETKDGVASAHRLAFRHALASGYARIVEMDADFSHLPEDLPALIAGCADAQVTLGSRCVSGASIVGRARWRNVLTRLGGAYARAVLRLPVRDCTGGFRCSSAAALRALDLDRLQSHGYGFQLELNWAWKRAGVSVAEIPIVFRDRTVGASKMNLGILIESLVMVLRLRCGLVSCAAAARPGLPVDRAMATVER